MMQKTNPTLVHSEYKHYPQDYYPQNNQLQIQNKPYELEEHFTSISQQHYGKTFIVDSSRPHLNVTLDNQYKAKALVDSGSTICLGDSSLIKHLKMQYPTDIPINVTDVHRGRKPTLGSYSANLTVTDKLPYPIDNEPIKIHMQNNLSSELVLGADFLKKHGAVINMKDNSAIFMPEEYHPVSLSKKPIVCEAFASIVSNDEEIEQEDLGKYNTATFAVQPTEDVESEVV